MKRVSKDELFVSCFEDAEIARECSTIDGLFQEYDKAIVRGINHKERYCASLIIPVFQKINKLSYLMTGDYLIEIHNYDYESRKAIAFFEEIYEANKTEVQKLIRKVS